ncbi:MAG: hypothetical protein IT581_20120 [Verrucomicrobiales bacterium]|nr:hypothetical protein [Verrucomicrobiales bacterium]
MTPTSIPADAGQTIQAQNLDDLIKGSANLKTTLAKGQQQYSTPPQWASRFAQQLPCQRPRTCVDWQCGSGNLLVPMDRAVYIWGVDVDKRFHGTIVDGLKLSRITDSCLSVWDNLKKYFQEVRFECQVANPPFGLPWVAPDFKLGRATSTSVTWKRIRSLACEGGYGYFIAGRKQLEAIGIHKHEWAYLYQTFPANFFPGADIEIGVVHWLNGAHPNPVHLEFKTTDPHEHPTLPQELMGIVRDRVQGWLESDETDKAMREIYLLVEEERRQLPSHNFIMKGQVLSVNFTNRFRLDQKLSRDDLERLMEINGRHPLTLVHDVHTRRLLREVVERGIFTVAPAAEAAIREALVESAKMATPLMPVTDFERVAYVDELDNLEVHQNFNPAEHNWVFNFRPGKKYSHRTGAYTFRESFTRMRVHYSEDEERTFALAHNCELSGQDRYVEVHDESGNAHRFMDRPDPKKPQTEHHESLLWKIFVKPNVVTVAEELGDLVKANIQRLAGFASTMNV